MPSAKDVTEEAEFIKAFVVGPPGSGKSVFASTFPTPGFIFDFGNGILSYRGLDFDYEQYPTSPDGWVKFERDIPVVRKAVDDNKYTTIIVDDLTAMGDLAMERALQLDPKRSPTNGPLWNVHYQMVRNLMEGRLRQLINLSANLVFIAHQNYITDDKGALIDIQPLMVGQLAERFPGYFDEVYYTSTRRIGVGNSTKTEWVIQTVPIGMKKARSRLSGKEQLLPELIPNTYQDLMSALKKSKEAKAKAKEAQNTK